MKYDAFVCLFAYLNAYFYILCLWISCRFEVIAPNDVISYKPYVEMLLLIFSWLVSISQTFRIFISFFQNVLINVRQKNIS